jgi:hypothetical protein
MVLSLNRVTAYWLAWHIHGLAYPLSCHRHDILRGVINAPFISFGERTQNQPCHEDNSAAEYKGKPSEERIRN